MKQRLFLISMMFCLWATLQAQNAGQALTKKVYDETLNPIEQIDQALSRAQAEGKFVICQVGGNWCPWCLRLADFITNDAEINQMIEDNFVWIHVNYRPGKRGDESRAELERQMLRRLGNPSRFGYPVLVVLDAQGTVIHTQDSAFLEEGKSYNADKVKSFLKRWTPSAVTEARAL